MVIEEIIRLEIGDEVFAVRDNQILKVEFVKFSKRGSSAFFKNKHTDEILISLHKVFKTEKEAKILLEEIQHKKISRSAHTDRRKKESEKISEICHNIWLEFDIEIPFLSRPYSVEEAGKLYRRLKREHRYN